MQTSDWVLIGTTLFLGATALFVPYLAELVKRKAFAPALRIEFELAPPFCSRTSWRSKVDPKLEEPVYYHRLRVVNVGKSQAKQVEAILEDLWLYDASGKPKQVTSFKPVNMRWSRRGDYYLDINPGRGVYCDIGHLSSLAHQAREERHVLIDVPGRSGDGLRFLLDLMEYPFSQPSCFLPGRYAIRISFCSEYAARQEAYFQIDWSGRWQDSEPEMFQELVVQRVDRVEG